MEGWDGGPSGRRRWLLRKSSIARQVWHLPPLPSSLLSSSGGKSFPSVRSAAVAAAAAAASSLLFQERRRNADPTPSRPCARTARDDRPPGDIPALPRLADPDIPPFEHARVRVLHVDAAGMVGDGGDPVRILCRQPAGRAGAGLACVAAVQYVLRALPGRHHERVDAHLPGQCGRGDGTGDEVGAMGGDGPVCAGGLRALYAYDRAAEEGHEREGEGEDLKR